MKKYLLLLSAIIITLASCTSSPSHDQAKQAATDDSLIRVYLKANPRIQAKKDPSGIYYQVLSAGSGTAPNINSTVTVNYTGTLLNDFVFDKASEFTSPLNSLIPGWQTGIPLIRPGGTILLIIPSGLAYGVNNVGRVPENSVLVFNIDLLSFR